MQLSESTRNRISSLITSNQVVLFMKGTRRSPQCGFSAQVVEMLDELLPTYETVDVLSAPDIREGVKLYSDWPTIPQLYVDGNFIGGCDIVRELHASGELRKLLKVPEGRADDEVAEGTKTNGVIQLDAARLKAMLDRGEIALFDVRPDAERDRAKIAQARPLDAAGQEYLFSLEPSTPVAVHCHHGVRSQRVAEQLLEEGFQRVYNLRGGIDAWSRVVDPTVPRY